MDDPSTSGRTDASRLKGVGRAAGVQRAVKRALGWMDEIVGGIAALALLALIAVVFANVIGRYGFNSSLTWASEAAQWLFICVIFLAIPLAHRSRMHMSISFLVDPLPRPVKEVTHFVAELVVALSTVMLLFGGTFLIQAVGGTNHVLNLPVWVKFATIPVSCILGLTYLAVRGFEEDRAPWRAPLAVLAAFALYWAFNDGALISLRGFDPGWIMALCFIAAMAIGTPVAFAMVFSAFMANEAGGVLPPAAVVQNMVNGSSKFLLLAIPLFIAAGALMNAGGLTSRLMNFAFALVGHFRGGFAQVNVLSSGLYAGISGSSYSEAALGAKLLVTQMVKRGYTAGFSCAVTAASATLPNVIPPSVALLILAAVSNQSVGSLWLAGVMPGILMGLCLMLCIYAVSRRHGYGAAVARATGAERWRAFVGALPVLLLAVLIIGGIRFGVVTPTEAGVLAVVYTGFLGLAVYRAYDGVTLWQTLRAAAVDAAMVGLLIGAAAPFTFILATEQVPQTVIELAARISQEPWVVLLIANILMLFFGMFMDIGAAVLILTPLLMPVMVELGVDPVHFGIVIVMNLMLGGLTPPVGMLVFITGAVSRTPAHETFKAMTPLLCALIVALMLTTYIPDIALGLGQLLAGFD